MNADGAYDQRRAIYSAVATHSHPCMSHTDHTAAGGLILRLALPAL